MKYFILLLVLAFSFTSCMKKETDTIFTIAFGSCNNQVLKNNLWNEIEKNNPDIWIWGGDVIYSDTEDMIYLKNNYEIQKNDSDYSNFNGSIGYKKNYENF